MADFISNLYIHSFRGIHSLELEDLNKINILTGDNNSGKTSVLEVLQSFARPYSFRMWRSLLRKEPRLPSAFGMSYYEAFFNLFDIENDEKKIEYRAEFNNGLVDIKMTGRETEEEMSVRDYEKNVQMMHYIGRKEDSEEGEDDIADSIIAVPKLDLKLEINGVYAGGSEIYEGGGINELSGRVLNEYVKNIIYISPVRHAEGRVYLSEVLDHSDLYEEMLEVLKDYDEDIISINYVRGTRGGIGGEYKILSRTHKKALSLNVYGDGMKKAILLMSAVLKAKGGILLLDEFETAIHTSAMEKTFKWILETCQKLHVQLFLTSHSKEAISVLLKCAPHLQDDMALYTLYNDNEGMSVRRLSGKKAIEVQDDMGLELR